MNVVSMPPRAKFSSTFFTVVLIGFRGSGLPQSVNGS